MEPLDSPIVDQT